MANPFAVTPGPVIQDPNMGGGALVSALAQVLASQQQQREMQMRLQQLAIQQQQQQALAQYYQGTLSLQSREQGRLEGKEAAEQRARAQAGGAMQRAVGVAPVTGTQTGVPSVGTVDTSATASPLQQALQGGAQAIGGPQGFAQIFQGVEPENMGAAVQGLQGVQELAPKPPELPTAAKEFQFAQALSQIDPRLAQYFVENWVNPPKGPQNIINVGGDKYSTKRGELQATADEEAIKAARSAIAQFGTVDEAYKLSRKAITGFGAGAILNLNRALSALGAQPSKDRVSNTQTFQKLTGELALGYLRSRDLGSGTAVSDQDREFMLSLAAGNIALDAPAIRRTLRINAGAGIMKIIEAATALRERAIERADDAPALLREANKLEKQLDPQWARYAQMLAEEGLSVAEIREKLIRGGVTDPERLLRNLPKPDVTGTLDQIGLPKRR